MKFPFSKQLDSTDCGPACLQMISKYYGKFFSLNTLRELTDISRNGVNLRGINNAARTLGYKTKSVQMNWEQLSVQTHLPCIIHWDNNHFVVVYGVNIEKSRVKIADPAFGRIVYGKEEFLKHWITDDTHSSWRQVPRYSKTNIWLCQLCLTNYPLVQFSYCTRGFFYL